MWRDIVLFLTLAVLTNTAFPLSFDPVLLYFTAGHSLRYACAFAVVGSLSAGIAGVVDATLLRSLNRVVSPGWASLAPSREGYGFYAWTSLIAFSPLPFFIVRLALIRRKPNPIIYGLAVVTGRLPRYLLTVYVWRSLSLPTWMSAAIVLGAVVVAFHQWKNSSADC